MRDGKVVWIQPEEILTRHAARNRSNGQTAPTEG
jgi:hypothetical protein